MFNAFIQLVKRDLLLAMRRRGEMLNPVIFFIIVISLFPLALGPEPQLLQRMAPGIIWVAALLASMLALDSIFRSDFEDGSLEQLMLSPHPVSVLVAAKILAHWLVSGVPLIILSPLLAVMLYLPTAATHALWQTLLLGTPVLSLVGSIAVALTVGLRRGGMLLSILVLPLYVPVLIFAAGAVNDAVLGEMISAQLSFLGALLVLALTLAPLAAAAALRISLG